VSRYDDDIWRLVPEDPGPPPDHLARFVRDLDPVETALDLGCGDGRLSRELRASRLVLGDVSRVALARARERLPGAESVWLEPDAALPLEGAAFDLVLAAETLEHVRDVQLLLSEVRRVLRPGGTLAVTTPAHGRGTGLAVLARGFENRFDPLSPHIRFFTARSLGALLSELGFDVSSLRRQAGSLLATATR
jgi:SAM-dependent methyltransferase